MKSTIERFYQAFTHLDAETMTKCYHDEVVFEDPAFGRLHGERARNMWRMLCESQKGKDFVVSFSDITYEDGAVTAHWEAHYTFSQTGRKVHNRITAHFTFKEDKILTHTDTFNLHRWAGQAMGITGRLIGWTGFFKKKLQTRTNRLLDRYEEKKRSS